MTLKHSYWQEVSSYWQHLGNPLCPSQKDTQIIQDAVKKYHTNPEAIRLLLFGVTPEIAHIPWPSNIKMIAIEKSQEIGCNRSHSKIAI